MPSSQIVQQQDALQRKEAKQQYSAVVQTIKGLVQLTVPEHSIILSISKGDDDLIEFGKRFGWHFPRAINGKYAGCYPAHSDEAISQLETLRAQGAQYLLIPHTSFWWLEFYTDFTSHLQERYRIVTYHEDSCLIYCLL